jgi:hypothetical protein
VISLYFYFTFQPDFLPTSYNNEDKIDEPDRPSPEETPETSVGHSILIL